MHGVTPEPMGKVEAEAFYRSLFGDLDSPQLVFDQTLESGDSVNSVHYDGNARRLVHGRAADGAQDRPARHHHPPFRG